MDFENPSTSHLFTNNNIHNGVETFLFRIASVVGLNFNIKNKSYI